MRSIIQDKRGDVFQIIFLFAFITVVAILGLFFGFLSWKISGAYADMKQINDTQTAREANQRVYNSVPFIDDTFILFFFLFGVIGLLVAAARTEFNIIVMGLFIVLLFIAIFLASMETNLYRGLADDPSISDYSSQLTFKNVLFSKYMPLIVVLIGLLILLIMYGKAGGNIVR